MERAVLVVAWVCAAVIGVALAAILGSCAAAYVGPYTVELEGCREFSASCEAYVACRRNVAKKYGRSFEATCDGGSP